MDCLKTFAPTHEESGRKEGIEKEERDREREREREKERERERERERKRGEADELGTYGAQG